MIDRRFFLAGACLLPGTAAAAASLSIEPDTARPGDVGALRRSFASPPDAARPWVYWFWINGNITRAGITADLEAMQRVGLGGVLIMDVDPGTPVGPATFGSGEWRMLLDFAFAEAGRLGLEIRLNNDAGWSGSAGPWITPELSMQKLVWSELVVDGDRRIDQPLPVPETVRGFYRDVAVVAFPTPGDDAYRLPHIAFQSGRVTNVIDYLPQQGVPPIALDPPDLPAALAIDPAAVVDISHGLLDGRLTWQAPKGRWTIMRFGHTSTGSDNHPVSAAGQGLECDKMSRQAVGVHFAGFAGKIAREERRRTAGPLASIHIDSWEAGPQNWTPLFRDAFREKRGYDLLPYLPAISGRAVGGTAIAQRFLHDFRQTISDLIVENYAGEMRRLAAAQGLALSIEAYDGDPTAQLDYAAQADEPQTEFWLGRDFFASVHRSWDWMAGMTSAAHVFGKPIVAAEAFTAMPDENWQAHPATLKPLADWALSRGVNRFIIHRFAMQPWLDRQPGMTMGSWGTHYDRTQTWWETSGPWHLYLTRCQHMLRQGLPVADLLYLVPEDAPMRFAAPGVDLEDGTPPETQGYGFDGCPPSALFDRVTIRDGEIHLPSGARYRMLVLPEPSGDMPGAGAMTPRLLRRVAELVEQGMVLVGRPPVRSAGLSGYPACDAEVAVLVRHLWGENADRDTAGDRRVGLGRVVQGAIPSELLAASGLRPDFDCGVPTPFRYGHRRLSDGTDVYFVSNRTAREAEAHCRFRVSGRSPELWDPETGARTLPARYDEESDRTGLPLRLPAHGSVFVLFPPRRGIAPDHIIGVEGAGPRLPSLEWTTDGQIEAILTTSGSYALHLASGATRTVSAATLPAPVAAVGPWTVTFPEGLGAPARIVLPHLLDWTAHDDEGVRHFSGTARYSGVITVPPAMIAHGIRLVLDLGEVADIARVRLNGRDAGCLWKAPFSTDVTAVAVAGINRLEIDITNRWPNRIIGDAALPEDAEWKPGPFEGLPGFGETLVRWPQWLLDGKPSPTGRITFATWKTWDRKAPLLPSGLLGPVTINAAAVARAS